MKTYYQALAGDRKQVVYSDGNPVYETLDRILQYERDVNVPSPGVTNGDHVTPNPWSYTILSVSHMRGHVYTYRKSNGWMNTETIGSQGVMPYAAVDGNFTEIYNRCLGNLYDRMRAQIDWSVTLAQGGQVASMVRSANRTLQYVRSFKRLRLVEAYRDFMRDGPASKKLGGKWLEFQYGWKPLAQDLYNTAVELGRQFPALMTIKEKASERAVTEVYWPWPALGIQFPVDRVFQKRVRMDAEFSQNTEALNLLSNFTSLNPASIAWELTPFSFVVDWFVDVGGYMRNFESCLLMRNNFKKGFTVYTNSSSCKTYAQGSQSISDGLVRVFDAVGSYERRQYFRTVMYGAPVPKVPSFKADLGSGRLLNAAALMSQHLGRK